MDSVFRVLCFNIGTTDLQHILDTQGFKPTSDDDLRGWNPSTGGITEVSHEDYLKGWEASIERLPKLKVHFTSDWRSYKLMEGNGRKYLFCNTNMSEVVFVADAH
jgi:hypothetical protein